MCNAMKEWKLSIFNIVDKRIKFYSQNTNLLPPKPKSSFRHLKQGIQHQGLSEPEFYGDLVYKFKKIRGITDFSYQFRKIIMRYKRIGYNLNVM